MSWSGPCIRWETASPNLHLETESLHPIMSPVVNVLCAAEEAGPCVRCSKENLMSPGGFSEFVLLRERVVNQGARIIPDHVSNEAAAFLEPAACVLRGIDKADISDPEGCALIIGGGSMGLLHLVVLRAVFPALKIVVSDPVEERRALAGFIGATTSCPPEDLEVAVERLTDGLGADAVFDTVGGSQILISALGVLRAGGNRRSFRTCRRGRDRGV